MRAWLIALAAVLALALPETARADERILRFLSDVAVQREHGALEVTETIRLRSEGKEIQRGILRDFPTRYYDTRGREVRVGFEVLGVTRDGREEPWSTESIDNGERVRIGDADVLLEPGEHAYVIRYRTTKQVGFFPDFDELYWNATGTGWTFPIDEAEARIRLPQPVQMGQRAFYTGPQGASGQAAEVVSEAPGEIVFRTTAPLGAYEGLTVAVAWPKGVVVPPPPPTPQQVWAEKYGPPIAAVAVLAGLLGYYFYAWARAGRGPAAGTVVPIFSPPDDLSPAALRYVANMGFDNRAFAAAIVDLGVRGKLRLVEEEGGFFSAGKTRIEKVDGGMGDLPAPERAMFSTLLGSRDSIELDNKNHSTFQSSRSALQTNLERAYLGTAFHTNRHWAAIGVALVGLALMAVAATIIVTAIDGAPLSFTIICVLIALAGFAAAILVSRWARGRGTGARVLSMIGTTLLGSAAGLAAFITIGTAFESERFYWLGLPLLALPLAISAFWWMAAPTREGRKLMDRIAGFERYLSIAEEDRLETMHPPEKTPQLFERYLPHAIALKVENAWASRFSSVLAAAAASGQTHPMGWYSGSGDPWNDTDRFVYRVGSSLSSTVSSASTAPGSSSGSGGGGSSGGGGGGGGGSGW